MFKEIILKTIWVSWRMIFEGLQGSKISFSGSPIASLKAT